MIKLTELNKDYNNLLCFQLQMKKNKTLLLEPWKKKFLSIFSFYKIKNIKNNKNLNKIKRAGHVIIK